MDWQTIAGLAVRHLLTTLAGSLVTLGLIQSSDSAMFVSMGTGIVVGAAGIFWSWWQKKGHALVVARLNGQIDYLKAQKLGVGPAKAAQGNIPPQAPGSTAQGSMPKAVIALLAVALGSLLFAGQAHAQSKGLPKLPNPFQPPNSSQSIAGLTPQAIAAKIRALSLKDFVYADALAKATGNKITEPCWAAWVMLLTNQQQPLIGPSLSETVSWSGSGPTFTTVAPHNLMVGQEVQLQNPPAGFTAGTAYYVLADGYAATAFELAASPGGMAIVATGSSSAGTVLTSPGQVLQPPDPGLITGIEYVSEAVHLLQPDSDIALACAPMAQAIQKDFATLAGSILSGGAMGLFKLPVAIP